MSRRSDRLKPGEGLEEWRKSFCALAMRRFKLSAEDADDAVQECFLMIWKEEQKLGRVNRDRALLWQWLGRAVYYHLKRTIGHPVQVPHKYRFYRMPRVLWNDLDDLNAPKCPGPEEIVFGMTLREPYDRTYFDLSGRYRWLLRMTARGYSPTEIAKIERTTPLQVRNALQRARRKFRQPEEVLQGS